MSRFLKWAFAAQLVGCAFLTASAQLPNCPLRPNSGTVVLDPLSLTSVNGTLSVALTERNAADSAGIMHYCFDYSTSNGDVEAPILRLNPGDTLVLDLTNQLNLLGNGAASAHHSHMDGMAATEPASTDPCKSTVVNLNTTNIHFHGLNIPPKCHQDDVVNTLIQPSKVPFRYSLQIPANEPPGLYWYHPHPHGLTGLQVGGGASGVIVIGGIEKIKPQVTGLTERVFILRQQFTTGGDETGVQTTLNFQPAIFPKAPSPIIQMKPGEKQFWRVLNSTSNQFLALQLLFGSTPQSMEVISLDGVPVTGDPTATTINVPPAGRAEFIVTGPPTGTAATFYTAGFDTGPVGDSVPPQVLADVVATANPVQASAPVAPTTALPSVTQRFSGLAAIKPVATRKLYFSEAFSGTVDPPNFFITVDGQQPKLFKMSEPPAIVTKVGAVEDWTIENRTSEMHAFHMHQIHFLVTAIDGVAVQNPTLQDTIAVPYWPGKGPYHNVTLRMDFRDSNIAGTFLYHCHILDHEDHGMMAKIRVDP